MGANHVSTIYAQWGRRLDGCAFRLLVHMSLTALDSDNPPMYWAGRDGMAAALGRDDDAAGRQAVKRALSVLKREGAVKVASKAVKGRSATRWEIVLAPPLGYGNRTPITKKPRGGAKGDGTETVPQSGTESDPIGVRNPTHWGTETDPQRTTRTTEERGEEEISSLTQVSPRARDEKAPKDEMTIHPIDAKRIVREFIDRGGVLADLLHDAPEGLTRTQRDIYAATLITEETA